jgi:hypothetical protein
MRHVPHQLDHLIVGCREVHSGIDHIQKLSGYRADMGGSHPGLGTWNALLGLGGRCYLEILAPDPKQEKLLWHQELLQLTEPLIIGWALRTTDLGDYASHLRKIDVPCVGPIRGSRARADGHVFRWTFLTLQDEKQGLMPFYIDWDSRSPHPSDEAPGACLLMEFSVIGAPLPSPAPRLRLKKSLTPARTSQLQAKIAGQFGVFELVSKAIHEGRSVRPQP